MANMECGFTLKCVRDMTITYSQKNVYITLCLFFRVLEVMSLKLSFGYGHLAVFYFYFRACIFKYTFFPRLPQWELLRIAWTLINAENFNDFFTILMISVISKEKSKPNQLICFTKWSKEFDHVHLKRYISFLSSKKLP